MKRASIAANSPASRPSSKRRPSARSASLAGSASTGSANNRSWSRSSIISASGGSLQPASTPGRGEQLLGPAPLRERHQQHRRPLAPRPGRSARSGAAAPPYWSAGPRGSQDRGPAGRARVPPRRWRRTPRPGRPAAPATPWVRSAWLNSPLNATVLNPRFSSRSCSRFTPSRVAQNTSEAFGSKYRSTFTAARSASCGAASTARYSMSLCGSCRLTVSIRMPSRW